MNNDDKVLLHQPVLLSEVRQYLKPRRGGNFFDATVGYGGHAQKIIQILNQYQKNYQYFGLDQDPQAIAYCQTLFENNSRVKLIHGNFREAVLLTKPYKFDNILADLGTSSPQLENPTTGISFQFNAPLDMRFDQTKSAGKYTTTAWLIVNKWPVEKMIQIFRSYGEETYARPIAKAIDRFRQKQTIQSTLELVEIIKSASPPSYRYRQKIHFATNIFRALRMAVNDELGALESLLKQLPRLANNDCRIVIISFQSLEDRLVKKYFKDYAIRGRAKILTPKPVISNLYEVSQNPRARSAKLRALEWIVDNST